MGGDRASAETATDLVLAHLAAARHGEIVAVWATGEISLEGFGFAGRKSATGREHPLIEFVATGTAPARDLVELRLKRAFTP